MINCDSNYWGRIFGNCSSNSSSRSKRCSRCPVRRVAGDSRALEPRRLGIKPPMMTKTRRRVDRRWARVRARGAERRLSWRRARIAKGPKRKARTPRMTMSRCPLRKGRVWLHHLPSAGVLAIFSMNYCSIDQRRSESVRSDSPPCLSSFSTKRPSVLLDLELPLRGGCVNMSATYEMI
jgi:hypothetical protein